MHLKRLTFGTLFLVLLVLSLFVFVNELFWFVPLIIVVAAIVGTDEFYRLCRIKGYKPLSAIGFVITVALLGDAYFNRLGDLAYIIIVSIGLIFCVQMLLNNFSETIGRTSITFFGNLYVAFPMALALYILRYYEHGGYIVFFLIMLGWSADTGAYAFGSAWGRTPLSPQISPNKTVEGSIAGLLSTILIALLLKVIFPEQSAIFTTWEMIFLAVTMGIIGQVGDLAESALKRDAGVKDAGDLGTGHGGVLDIIDSLLFCFPFLYLYIELLRPDLHITI